MRNTSVDTWMKFGKNDPYFGVLSDEKFRLKKMDEKSLNEFFDSGKTYVEKTLARIQAQYGIDLAQSRILDFGCGVGRLAIPFSQVTKKEVVGIDISPEVLETAKSHSNSYRLENLHWMAYDGKTLPDTGTFDFINTYIVLQHIETHTGMSLIRQMLERLNAGGLIQLQVTYGHRLPRWKYLHYRWRSKSRLYNSLYSFLSRGQLFPEPMMQMNPYKPNDLFELFRKYSDSVHVEFTDHGGYLGASDLVKRER